MQMRGEDKKSYTPIKRSLTISPNDHAISIRARVVVRVRARVAVRVRARVAVRFRARAEVRVGVE
eukprot:485412-Amorphochlora_amoeboformis.AAC.1